MRITDNLKKDIHGAPKWFLEAINVEPKEKYIENPKEWNKMLRFGINI